MIARILNKIFRHKIVVNCDRKPYLTRWYVIRTSPIAVFIHRFHKSDDERSLHDHPWGFVTFILWRGYYEHTPGWDCPVCGGGGSRLNIATTPRVCSGCGGVGKIGTKISRKIPGMICYRPAEWRHRVELVGGKPAWTLVVRFKERRMWGFWEKTGFIPWNKWWQNNCE